MREGLTCDECAVGWAAVFLLADVGDVGEGASGVLSGKSGFWLVGGRAVGVEGGRLCLGGRLCWGVFGGCGRWRVVERPCKDEIGGTDEVGLVGLG